MNQENIFRFEMAAKQPIFISRHFNFGGHLKQTNKQTNKNTKTNKQTKQNKTKQKTK